MTFGVTSEGFKAKKFDDLITELGEDLKSQLEIDIDADPDSIAKVLTNIYALPLAEEWALTQSLQSMFDIDKAEGVHLDNLVGYLGLRRIQEAYTAGDQYVTTDSTLTIPAESEFLDADSNIFTNPSSLIVSPSNCSSLTLYPAIGTFVTGKVLTITVNGAVSSVTKTSGESTESFLSRLVSSVSSSDNGCTAELGLPVDYPFYLITITTTLAGDTSTISYSEPFQIEEITSLTTVQYSEYGEYYVPPDTVVTPPNITGIVSTNNPSAYVTGRLDETDSELRARHAASLSSAGAATIEAIRADLLNISGVTTAIVLENDTEAEVDTIPAKSFLCIVKGGDDQDIGESLWLSKPAGISTAGDNPVSIVDSQGNTQVVYFKRPDSVYVWFRVTYSVYGEDQEDFPSDGEDQMNTLLVQYGDELDIGEDVIPQRFASQVFQNIGGLQSVVIEVQETVSQYDTPNPANWQLTTLPIDSVSEAAFASDRVEILVEV